MEYNWQDYIKPELLLMIPVLNGVGFGIKKAKLIDSKYIPLMLVAIGCALTAMYVGSTATVVSLSAMLGGIFTSITQGTLCASAAVMAYNVYKQNIKKD